MIPPSKVSSKSSEQSFMPDFWCSVPQTRITRYRTLVLAFIDTMLRHPGHAGLFLVNVHQNFESLDASTDLDDSFQADDDEPMVSFRILSQHRLRLSHDNHEWMSEPPDGPWTVFVTNAGDGRMEWQAVGPDEMTWNRLRNFVRTDQSNRIVAIVEHNNADDDQQYTIVVPMPPRHNGPSRHVIRSSRIRRVMSGPQDHMVLRGTVDIED